MRHLASKLLFLGLLSVLGLRSAGAAGPETPEALIEAYQRAWNTHDIKALASLFTEDAEFGFASGDFIKGRAEIQAGHERSHGAWFRKSTGTFTITSLRFLHPDVALIRHDGVVTGVVDEAGKPTPDHSAVALVVAIKTADGWRIVAKQATRPRGSR